jgi:uncharacterized protein (TIGR02687 family)
MINIDYQLAKKEIESNFFEKHHRTIIFWYDETKNFLNDIKEDIFENAKVIIYENNDFAIKHLLEVEDLENNYLIYFPCEKPNDKENWLLDILIYSIEYYADPVALTMRKLGLTNSYLRKIVDKYNKFFKNESRINDLRKQVTINDNVLESDMMNGMLAVIVKAKSTKTAAILTELIFDVEIGDKYKEINNFGLKEYLWNQITTYSNYSGEQSILSLIKQYMMTALEKTSKIENYSSFYKQFIIESSNQASNDALLLVDNLKNDTRYENLQSFIGDTLRITELIQTRGIDGLGNSDVFQSLDIFIIKSIFESLATGSLDYDFFENIVKNNRINSYWYSKHQIDFESILKIISFNRSLDYKIFENQESEDYIKIYKESLYKIDMHYRHAIHLLNQIDNYEDSIDILKNKLNHLYEVHLNFLGSRFSKSLEKKKSWNFIGETSLHQFYNEIQRINFKKMFIIISDAFRYEVAYELNERIESDTRLKGRSDLKNMIAPLPSITKLGMASLLPNKDIQYGSDILVDGMSSNSTNGRHKILTNRNESYAAIRYDEISIMNRSDIREFMKDKSLVYIYHNSIDTAGEHQESRVFDASNDSINEIHALVVKLYQTLQISNFIITADHGYLYRNLKVDDALKYNDVSKIKPLELSRRYAIVNDESDIPYTLKFKLDYLGKNIQHVIVPYSYDYFKSSGGIQYVHGGASLQEIVVPFLIISELRSGALKDSFGPVGVRIKSINRVITQRSFTIDFEQFEQVAEKKTERKLITYFVDDQGKDVSGRYPFLANSESDELSQRITRVRFTLNNIDFHRDKRYMLILKDENQGDSEYLEKEVFKIDILGFKTIF